MTQTFNKGKIVLDTIAQFQTLSTTGTLVIDGVTITYDPNHYDYWVKEKDYYTKDEVVANPTGTSLTDLTKLEIGGTVYNIPSGGGGLYEHSITLSVSDDFSLRLIVLSNRGTQYTLNDLQGLMEIRNFVRGYFSDDSYDHAYVLTRLITPQTTIDSFTAIYLDASNFYTDSTMAMSEYSYIYDDVIQL